MKIIRRSSRTLAVATACAYFALGTAPALGGEHDGRWVMVQKTVTAADVPVIGEIHATSVVVSLHDLVESDGRLRGAGKLCKISLDSGTSMVKTILPKAFRRTLPHPVIDAKLTIGEGGTKLTQPARTIVVGAKLRRSNDPLPSDPDDPRVFDQDGDGNPGVTIRVEGIVSGDMYIVQRSWTRLEGALLGDGSFGGRLFFGNAQVVLDSTSPFLGDPPSSRPLPNLSWFRIARLPEDADCAKARERAAAWR